MAEKVVAQNVLGTIRQTVQLPQGRTRIKTTFPLKCLLLGNRADMKDFIAFIGFKVQQQAPCKKIFTGHGELPLRVRG